MTKSTEAKTNQIINLEKQPEQDRRDEIADAKVLDTYFGAKTPAMSKGLLRHCFRVLGSNGKSSGIAGNEERFFLAAAVSEIEPRDGVERMLAVQMAATHFAIVRAAEWISNAQTTDQIAAHTNGYTKLARAYTAQMEALRKHRNGGKQTVVIQHVNVEEGGQAIVGNVQPGEGQK